MGIDREEGGGGRGGEKKLEEQNRRPGCPWSHLHAYWGQERQAKRRYSQE